MSVAAAENLPVVNNAKGGSLAAYALMSMDGGPVEVTFKVDTIPAKANGVMVDGELVYGEGVTPSVCTLPSLLLAMTSKRSWKAKPLILKLFRAIARLIALFRVKKYTVRLKNSGGVDGICVLATAKNDINGANLGNWQTVLERIKSYVENVFNKSSRKNRRVILS